MIHQLFPGQHAEPFDPSSTDGDLFERRASVTIAGQLPGDQRVRIARRRQRPLSRRVTALVHRVLGA